MFSNPPDEYHPATAWVLAVLIVVGSTVHLVQQLGWV
jgi:hypothetical protein